MRISDWSSDVCSSDLGCSAPARPIARSTADQSGAAHAGLASRRLANPKALVFFSIIDPSSAHSTRKASRHASAPPASPDVRSEEHTSELQSLMRISYAVFCLKKKNEQTQHKFKDLMVINAVTMLIQQSYKIPKH